MDSLIMQPTKHNPKTWGTIWAQSLDFIAEVKSIELEKNM